MAQIPITLGAYHRSLFPEAILLNAYVEPAPTQQAKPNAIRARSGHEALKALGTASLRGMVAKAGLFSDTALILMGSEVYTLDASGAANLIPGTLSGLGLADVDSGQDADLNSEAWAATGSALYHITESSVALSPFPTAGGPGASSVCCFRGYVIASEAGTDQVFVRVPGDATWVALSFISAEYAPDKVIAVRRLGEQIWLLGQSTSEAWALAASATPPLAPYGGLVFDFGCRARDSAVSMPGALIWVDDACQVRMTQGGNPEVISDVGLAEQIRSAAAGDLRASWFQKDGHLFYVLTIQGDTTWTFDVTTKQWHRRSTLGYEYSRIAMFATLGDTVLAGDSVSNQIYTINPDAWDDAGSAFSVEFTAFAELAEGKAPCANLEVICEVGNAPYEGAGSDPIIEMRYSDDNGKSWSRWRERPLGLEGQSTVRVRWNALGTISAPYGRIFHFRVTEPVARRFSDLRLNVV